METDRLIAFGHPANTHMWFACEVSDPQTWLYIPVLDETAPGFSVEVLVYGYWVDGPSHRPMGQFTSGYRSSQGTWETHIRVIGYHFVPLMWQYFPKPPCELPTQENVKHGRGHTYYNSIETFNNYTPLGTVTITQAVADHNDLHDNQDRYSND